MRGTAIRRGLTLAGALATVAGTLGAQTDRSRDAGDSVLQRARQLVNAARDAEGRKLIDSLLHASTPRDPIYAEALYTRAAMAPNAAEAERDYRRLLIEAPLAPRAEDAMLQLANLLQARGDRRGAAEHLQRFMLSFANSPARPRAAVSLVRLLFEQGPSHEARACETLRQAREAVPRENLELRNQLEFYAPRCAMSADAAATSASASPSPALDTPRRPSEARSAARPVAVAAPPAAAGAPAGSGHTFYSVQIAAYNSEEAARRVARILVERGIDARVDGRTQPFRVRVGRYATRAEAAKALASLKSQGHAGFIAVVEER